MTIRMDFVTQVISVQMALTFSFKFIHLCILILLDS